VCVEKGVDPPNNQVQYPHSYKFVREPTLNVGISSTLLQVIRGV